MIAGIQESSVTVVEVKVTPDGSIIVVLRMDSVVNAINNKQVTDGVLKNAVNAVESQKINFVASVSSSIASSFILLVLSLLFLF